MALQLTTGGRPRPEVATDAERRRLDVRLPAAVGHGCGNVGWQVFDPETATFIFEGPRIALPAESAEAVATGVDLPPDRGRYHVYVSGVDEERGWAYMRGLPFVLLDVSVENGRATLHEAATVTLRELRRRRMGRSLRRLFTLPVQTISRNAALIRSMVRRDILARYRGSFGDVFWTVLNPLLMMLTYYFVFGVVLGARFGGDTSRSGFVLYFLAGMLPWLAFSEAVGRSPNVVVEHRNFVKKLVFPVEILPVNLTVSGLVTELFALGLFLLFVLGARGGIPATALWLPAVLVPQLLFTLGMAWLFAAIGVYVRDLGQVMGFLLTLLFFLTPICYPEAALPPAAAAILTKNPIFVMVRAYRAIFLEAAPPPAAAVAALWVLSAAVFLGGHAVFYKLRKSFADVI